MRGCVGFDKRPGTRKPACRDIGFRVQGLGFPPKAAPLFGSNPGQTHTHTSAIGLPASEREARLLSPHAPKEL